jgi:hypothetical protein
MTNGVRFAQGIQVSPVLLLADHGATSTNANHVNISAANWLSFLVSIGATSSATSNALEITAVASTASDSGSAVPTAIPFTYRLFGGAVGTYYGWGANTTGSSAGLVAAAPVGTTTDKVLWIDVDPAQVAVLGNNYKWAYLLFTTSASSMSYNCVAFLEPRYPGNSIPSST